MAMTTREGVQEVDVVAAEVVPARLTLSWGAIIGGAVAAFALWLLLYVFGLAVGLSSIDAANPRSLRPSGMFAGVWAVIAPLVALFIGGWVAGHGAGLIDRGGGAVHGLVVWGLTTIIGASMIAMMLSAVIGGVFSAGRAVAQAGEGAVGAAARASGDDPDAAETLGIDFDDALAPVNERLRAEGRPTVSAAEVRRATRQATQTLITTGRLDRDAFVDAIVTHTSLSGQDAEEIAGRVEARVREGASALAARAQSAAQGAERGALRAAERSGHAFFGLFGALLLGLLASVAGGAAGAALVGPRRRRVAPRTARPPVAPPREVYP
jgi:hypothetical protein